MSHISLENHYHRHLAVFCSTVSGRPLLLGSCSSLIVWNQEKVQFQAWLERHDETVSLTPAALLRGSRCCRLIVGSLSQSCCFPTYKTIYLDALHCTALHCTALHCTAMHCSTLHYTTLHYTTLHYTTLHYTTLHYTTLHYTTLYYITLHYTTLHYTTLHYATPIDPAI